MVDSKENEKLENLKKYMLKEFGVTPDNIDKKLNELKKQFIKKLKRLLFNLKGG